MTGWDFMATLEPGGGELLVSTTGRKFHKALSMAIEQALIEFLPRMNTDSTISVRLAPPLEHLMASRPVPFLVFRFPREVSQLFIIGEVK